MFILFMLKPTNFVVFRFGTLFVILLIRIN